MTYSTNTAHYGLVFYSNFEVTLKRFINSINALIPKIYKLSQQVIEGFSQTTDNQSCRFFGVHFISLIPVWQNLHSRSITRQVLKPKQNCFRLPSEYQVKNLDKNKIYEEQKLQCTCSQSPSCTPVCSRLHS